MAMIKVSEATDVALNYLVAKCEGHTVGIMTAEEQWARFIDGASESEMLKHEKEFQEIRASFKTEMCKIHSDGYKSTCDARAWRYSTDWAQGGPIIDKTKIGFLPADGHRGSQCQAFVYSPTQHDLEVREAMGCLQVGPTILIAAMRCYVISKLGEEVEAPDELLNAIPAEANQQP